MCKYFLKLPKKYFVRAVKYSFICSKLGKNVEINFDFFLGIKFFGIEILPLATAFRKKERNTTSSLCDASFLGKRNDCNAGVLEYLAKII